MPCMDESKIKPGLKRKDEGKSIPRKHFKIPKRRTSGPMATTRLATSSAMEKTLLLQHNVVIPETTFLVLLTTAFTST